ncbi:Mitogen-activated protein kinase 1 [Morella rubra]|uniref:Mitogen-activated protein kinase 1 n=1 Tax=Morella rubra TaxID=262757 RepID=A0A6A1WNI3_9ROSI|nr:Mitogen-activated protein kinase 1 [Morella rubra]
MSTLIQQCLPIMWGHLSDLISVERFSSFIGPHAVEESLAHPYFARLHDIADEPVCPEAFSFDFEQQPLDEEQMKDMIYQEALAFNPHYA